MTSRERFLQTMRYGRPDRVPCFDEGLRDGVLERWHEQGLPEDAEVADVFHYDRRERIAVDMGLRPGLKKWPTSRRGLKALRRRLDPADGGRFPDDWAARVEGWRTRDHVLELPLHSGFFLSMGVGEWRRFADVVYQVSDSPALVREMLELWGELVAEMAERVLSDVQIDFASFSEPIGGNDRPLLSPRQYEELVLPTYRPVLEVLWRRGVEIICYITYANARVLLESVVRAGFNCLWACEVNVQAMDYRDLRRRFGRDLRLIGGIDLDALLVDRAAIRHEIEQKAVPLVADGGYIPLADGRVRENTPLRNYAYYRRMLEQVARRR